LNIRWKTHKQNFFAVALLGLWKKSTSEDQVKYKKSTLLITTL
jgi:hypothetical protein